MSDKKYPRSGTSPIQSSEDRDLASLRAKKARENLDVPQSDQIRTIFDEPTKPTQLVQMRIDDDPAYAALWNRVSRMKQDLLGTTATAANTAMEALSVAGTDVKLAERLDHLESSMDKLTTVMGIMKWIAGFVIATVLGSVIVIATKIFSWGSSSGTIEMKIQYLEKAVDSNTNRIERLSGSGRRDYLPLQPPIDTKGTSQ